jgi:hypothetical protein
MTEGLGSFGFSRNFFLFEYTNYTEVATYNSEDLTQFVKNIFALGKFTYQLLNTIRPQANVSVGSKPTRDP